MLLLLGKDAQSSLWSSSSRALTLLELSGGALFWVAEALSTVCRRKRTSTHSLNLLGHSLVVAEDAGEAREWQEPRSFTVPRSGALAWASLLMSQHSGSSLVRKVS